MENCRAMRISGTCAAAVVACATMIEPATTGSHNANRAMRMGIPFPPSTSSWPRLCSETGVVLGRHDLHAPHVARLIWSIVGHRVVHGADVVPHEHLPL